MFDPYEQLELMATPNEVGSWLSGLNAEQQLTAIDVMDQLGYIDGPSPIGRPVVLSATRALASHGLQRVPRIFFDSEPISALGGPVNLELFATNAGKTPRQTNMVQPGNLSNPQRLFVKAIAFKFRYDTPAPMDITDLSTILDYGRALFRISDKDQLEIPMLSMAPWPGSLGASLDGAAAAVSHGWQNGDYSGMLTFKQPFVIRPTVNFRVNVSWDAAATPSANGRLFVAFLGPGWRSIQ